MKKFIFPIMLFLLAATVLSSCGGFLGIDLTDQKSIDNNLRERIEEVTGPQAAIVNINLIPSGDFSKTMNYASVHYYPEGEQEMVARTINLSGAKDSRDGIVSTFMKKIPIEDAVALSQVDFSGIADNVNRAATALQEEEYEFSGIARYEIEVNSDPSKMLHKFTLESREGSETKTRNGRLVTETSYYEFKFEVDAEGEITAIE